MVNVFPLRWIPGLFCCWLLISGGSSFAQNTRWQQTADYRIQVTLNTLSQTLDGSLNILYRNASPDTLSFIWVHLWPNAYKSDKTAFASQQLMTGETGFYFSQPGQKGYINQLNFTANGKPAWMEDHPQHLDITKVVLPEALLPGQTVQIATPFHVQLPYRFSRMGYIDSFYSITQWFPKVAVYDEEGWHPMPYLQLGEYYADFGTYNVEITLPANYMVAATGVLQTESERNWLLEKSRTPSPVYKPVKKTFGQKTVKPRAPSPQVPNKTISFKAEKVVDFAWFAYPDWQVKYDTIRVNGQRIDAWNFVLPAFAATWHKSMDFTREAIMHYSNEAGPYPYPQVTVVCDPYEKGSGMEYPMITGLNTFNQDEDVLRSLIVHEIGHNWFQAVLASNERQYPWLDEGLNTYIEEKIENHGQITTQADKKKPETGLDFSEVLLNLLTSKRIDQPIMTPSEKLAPANYYTIPYTKTAQWLNLIEGKIGAEKMKQAMQAYFREGAFHHVQPDDLKRQLEATGGIALDKEWDALRQTGPVTHPGIGDPVFPGDILLNRAGRKNKAFGIAPALGFNEYDKMQAGLLLHNYSIPLKPFQWVATPMYATGSGQITGYARAGYTFFPKKGNLQQVELFTSAAHFNTQQGSDLNNQKVFGGFTKFMPGVYLEHKKKDPLSTLTRWMELKSWIIRENPLLTEQAPPPGDTAFYQVKGSAQTTLIPQLTMGWKNTRALYPYEIQAGVQQVKDILRLTAEARYFFNYNATGKGIHIRAFAGKIFYLKEKTDEVRIDNSRYHFTMYGPNGDEDYTYSTPFMERNQSTTLSGRQIMMRDGFFKYRSDYSSVKPGLNPQGLDFFDNWLATLHFTFDIPDKINPLSVLPFDMPLKIFADMGTSASAWKPESEQEKFLYSIGLHLPIAKVLHVYYPIIDSDAFEEPNSVNDPNRSGGPAWWQKNLTFSLDLQALKPRISQIPILR